MFEINKGDRYRRWTGSSFIILATIIAYTIYR